LRVTQVLAEPAPCRISFTAMPERTYSVLARDSLATGAWLKIGDVPSRPTTRTESVLDNRPAVPQRYYRLVTPAVP